jgi:hypothetical protein
VFEARMMEFFDHVTGKPLNVFIDQTCAIVHAQPVIRSATGQWPPVFLEGGDWAEKAYGVRFLNADGREIFRVSPLVGEPKMRSIWWRVLFG